MAKKRKPLHPGVILEGHYLKPLKISKAALADAIGVSRKTLYKILNGESSVTAAMAVRLSKALKTSPELWLNLQQKYDIWEAEHDKTIKSENIKPIIPIAAHSRS